MAWATREKIVINPARKTSGPVHHRRAAHRKNTGGIYSWVLNPGRKPGGGKMAATKKKRKRSWSGHHKAATNPAKRRNYSAKTRSNRRRSRTNPRRHYGRRNPMGINIGDLVQAGLWGTVGAVGSKLLTQVVLGASNTGAMGYLGNVVAGVALGLVADKGLKSKQAAFAIYVGTAIQLVIRAINDFTPYGQYAALSGVGDYQISNFVTPQRYVDALHSAQIKVPNGWGGGAVIPVQSSGVPADHAIASGTSGWSQYEGGSIY